MARGDLTGNKEQQDQPQRLVETWRKVAGKHNDRVNGKPVRIGKGQPDGETMEFPVGRTPVERGLVGWVRIKAAPAEAVRAAAVGPLALEVKKVGPGKFNVLRKDTGLPINAQPLKKAEADALAGQMAGDDA